jgi:hypothetical protein
LIEQIGEIALSHRFVEMEVRMGRLRAIDIHPIERKPSTRQGSVP